MKMKRGSKDRTKIVLRHLPPTITQAQLLEQIDGAFAGRYHWYSFRPGKNHRKHPSYSRAYIDFDASDDVIQFAVFFDGHLFVNEKGSQYKVIVEYAPSQRVPKKSLKKDGRLGTISKDAEYKDFLEYVTKPVDKLPSAEIQLERRSSTSWLVRIFLVLICAIKESPIVTPLMEFIRQKRSASGRVYFSINGSLTNGMLNREFWGLLDGNSRHLSERRRIPTTTLGSLTNGMPSREFWGLLDGNSRHLSEMRRIPTTLGYVSRESAKSTNVKDNSIRGMFPKRDDQEYSGEPVNSTASKMETMAEDSGMSTHTDSENKKIPILKGKGKEIHHASRAVSQQHNLVSSIKNLTGAKALRQNQCREGTGRILRNLHVNQDSHSSQHSVVQMEQKVRGVKLEDRLSHSHVVTKGKSTISEDKLIGNEMHRYFGERNEKCARNRDQANRGVWVPRYSGSHASDASASSSASQPTHFDLESTKGGHGHVRHVFNAKSGGAKFGSGRSGNFHQDNGPHKHVGRQVLARDSNDMSGSLVVNERKSKRGGPPAHGSHEKQVWVQKSAAGS